MNNDKLKIKTGPLNEEDLYICPNCGKKKFMERVWVDSKGKQIGSPTDTCLDCLNEYMRNKGKEGA